MSNPYQSKGWGNGNNDPQNPVPGYYSNQQRQPGQMGQSGQYGSVPGQYGSGPGHYGQSEYGQPGQASQPAQYGSAPGPYAVAQPSQQAAGQHSQPGQGFAANQYGSAPNQYGSQPGQYGFASGAYAGGTSGPGQQGTAPAAPRVSKAPGAPLAGPLHLRDLFLLLAGLLSFLGLVLPFFRYSVNTYIPIPLPSDWVWGWTPLELMLVVLGILPVIISAVVTLLNKTVKGFPTHIGSLSPDQLISVLSAVAFTVNFCLLITLTGFMHIGAFMALFGALLAFVAGVFTKLPFFATEFTHRQESAAHPKARPVNRGSGQNLAQPAGNANSLAYGTGAPVPGTGQSSNPQNGPVQSANTNNFGAPNTGAAAQQGESPQPVASVGTPVPAPSYGSQPSGYGSQAAGYGSQPGQYGGLQQGQYGDSQQGPYVAEQSTRADNQPGFASEAGPGTGAAAGFAAPAAATGNTAQPAQQPEQAAFAADTVVTDAVPAENRQQTPEPSAPEGAVNPWMPRGTNGAQAPTPTDQPAAEQSAWAARGNGEGAQSAEPETSAAQENVAEAEGVAEPAAAGGLATSAESKSSEHPVAAESHGSFATPNAGEGNSAPGSAADNNGDNSTAVDNNGSVVGGNTPSAPVYEQQTVVGENPSQGDANEPTQYFRTFDYNTQGFQPNTGEVTDQVQTGLPQDVQEPNQEERDKHGQDNDQPYPESDTATQVFNPWGQGQVQGYNAPHQPQTQDAQPQTQVQEQQSAPENQQYQVEHMFWFAVPEPRPALDMHTGQPLFMVTPGEWFLALADHGNAFIVRNGDGREGILHNIAGVQRG